MPEAEALGDGEAADALADGLGEALEGAAAPAAVDGEALTPGAVDA